MSLLALKVQTWLFPPQETKRPLLQVPSIKEVEFKHSHPILQTDSSLDGSRIEKKICEKFGMDERDIENTRIGQPKSNYNWTSPRGRRRTHLALGGVALSSLSAGGARGQQLPDAMIERYATLIHPYAQQNQLVTNTFSDLSLGAKLLR
jgi:hypothetical protein